MSQATVPTSPLSTTARSTPPRSTTARSGASGSELHPTVKLALSYLDSSLEDELTRYRKARSGKRVAPSSVRIMQGTQKLASKAEVELTRFVQIDQMSKHVSTNSENSDPMNKLERVSTGSGSLATEFLDQLAVIPEDGARRDESTNDDEGLDSAYSLGDLLSNPSIDNISLSTDDYGVTYGAEDYLESSEELLRSLAQEEADAEAERSGLENLMTPFGIGSMLLMLMASGMFGYLVMNPATFASIGSVVSRLFTTPPVTSNPTSSPVAGESGDIPSSGEFMDLSLNNLSALGTQTNPGGLPKLPGLPMASGKPGKLGPQQPIVVGGVPVKSSVPGKPGQPTGNLPSSLADSNAPATGGGLFPSGNANLEGGGIFKNPSPPEAQPTFAEPRYADLRPSAPRQPAPEYRAPARSSAPAPIRTVPIELPPSPSTPTSIPPAPIESASPAAPEYGVRMPYTGDQALEKAQQAVPGAYFKNGENGAEIQMGGSYKTREEAEAKAQELKKQGFDQVEVAK